MSEPMKSLVVLWRVTERCDLACGFCAYDRRLRRSRREAAPERVLRFAEVLARYQRAARSSVLVSWIGGEPLLWAPLARVSASLRSEHGLALGITTNGTLLHRPQVRALLLEHFAEVTVSVDGMAAFHAATRGRAGLFESLASSIAFLAADKRTARGGPLLRANVVLMRTNFDRFLPLCLTLARWGIEEVTFNQLGGRDRPEYFPANRLLPWQADHLAQALPRWRERLADEGLRLLGDARYVARIAAAARDERIAPADCEPGRAFLFIDEDGNVAPCSFTTREYAACIDELDSPQSISALPARYFQARLRSRAAACSDCPSTQVFGKWSSSGCGTVRTTLPSLELTGCA